MAVVVAYGPPDQLDRCLAALGSAYRVIVVDNSSSAETALVVAARRAEYIDPGRNVGFAAAVNLGLARRRPTEDALLLNPDATIDEDGVEGLRKQLAGIRRAACIAPAQHAPGSERPDRVQWPFPAPSRAWLEAVGLARLSRREGFVIGSVLLIKGAALDSVGPFDEGYFLYAEEADWQLRATRQGWTIQYCDQLTAEHVGAGTGGDPGRRELHFQASQARFVRKWYGEAGWQSYRSAVILGALARAIVRSGDGRRAAIRRAALYARDPARILAAALSGSEDGLARRGRRTARGRSHGAASDGRAGRLRDMRVVHVVCTDAFAGVERYVVSLATGLAMRGLDVTVVGGDRQRMPRELAGSGVEWLPGAGIAAATAHLWRMGRVDIIHAHMFDAELAAVLGRPRSRAPLVVTRHFAATRGSGAAARLVGRVLSRVPDEQLAISEFVARSIEGSSVVVEPGVPFVAGPDEAGPPRTAEPDGPDQAAESEPGARELIVLMVQRLEAEKHTEIGIEAFASSGLAAKGWKLHVAGSGAQSAALQGLADHLGVGEACTFLGAVEDIQQLHRSSSIFLATRPDEPFGISVVEAMASGIAVVAAAGGGHLETVGLAKLAALFVPGDSKDAARLLTELAFDESRRRAYGAELRDLARDHFSIDRQVERTIESYRAVIR